MSLDLATFGVALPLSAGAELSGFWRAPRSGLVAPTFRLGVAALESMDATAAVRLASVSSTLSVCPSRAVAGALSAAVCLRNVLGVLHGEARVNRLGPGAWLALGATGGEARLDVVLGRFLVEGRFGALGVWSRPKFRTTPSGATLQDTGALLLDAGVGLGAFF